MTYSIAILALHRLRRMIEPILKTEASKMGININIVTVDGVYDEAVRLIETMKDKIDVIICGQTHAQILKAKAFNCQIITLKPRAIDVINAILKASESGKNVALIDHYRPNEALNVGRPILEKLGAKVNHRAYTNIDELKPMLRDLINNGYDAVVGGTPVCETASKYSEIKAHHYFTNEALLESVTLALYLLKNNLTIQNLSREMDALINRITAGIIICNQSGQVRMLNSLAESIISCSREYAEGKYIGDLIPDFDILYFEPSDHAPERTMKFHNRNYRVFIDDKALNTHSKVIVMEHSDIDKLASGRNRKDSLLHAFSTFNDIIGSSKAIRETITLAKHYAVTRETILILGETGVGKDLFAQSIHNYSSRREHPFWAINCATLPENLLESELFGYEDGAFTGAKKGGKQGYFELANRGTIFLDEIGELSMNVQVKLLRVVEQQHILRLGGKHFIPTDVRVLCATNRNLIRAVRDGTFREDLFYRINVLQLQIPPLRMRKDDIRLLIEYFCKKIEPDGRIKRETVDFLASIMSDYDFPGNIRELENLIRRFLVVKMTFSTRAQLQEFFFNAANNAINASLVEKIGTTTKKEVNIEMISNAMSKCRGNKSKAARELGISRMTIWRKLKCKM